MLSLFLSTLLLLEVVRAEEVATPSSLLGPRNFNPHPLEAGQYLKEIIGPEPTKQGPVLFPNDAPPPPKPPLVVTARPLSESVARSELSATNSNQENQNIAQQSRLNRIELKPGFLARIKNYSPYVFGFPKSTQQPNYGYQGSEQSDYPVDYDNQPYAKVVEKTRFFNKGFLKDNRFNDYEEKTVLPPIYKALSDHAKEKVLKLKQKNNDYTNKYELQQPQYHQENYQNNHLDQGENDYNEDSNYAFSYIVRDQKTGDDFSHKQRSSGSATNGEYRVRLPDGRMQIVSYTADENGYKADVRYDSEDSKKENNIANNNYNYNQDYQSNNNIQYNNNAYPSPTEYYGTGQNNDIYQVNNANYQTHNSQYQKYETKIPFKSTLKPAIKDDYYNYPDESKEINDDYTNDYNNHNENYDKHSSKFAKLDEINNNQQDNFGVIVVPSNKVETKATVKPSYEEIKHLFDNSHYLYSKIPIELSVPSTTPIPNHYETTTERVVLIGGRNFYTNVRNNLPTVSSTPLPYYAFSTLAPVVSSVAPKNVDFSGAKPVLSNSFIERINKYLSF